jgi:hypothetical protein
LARYIKPIADEVDIALGEIINICPAGIGPVFIGN